jgi:hypothetical protein
MIYLRTQLKKVPTQPVTGAWFDRPELGYHSSRNSPSNTRGVAAFTLLEVILAVSIAGALLAGAATLMVSVTNAWLERQDRHFFEDHVDGVTEFLQASFSIAGTEIALGDEDGSSGSSSNETGNEIETDGSPVTVDISGNNNLEGGASMAGNNTEPITGSGLVRVSEDPIGWSQPPGFADYQDPLVYFKLRDTPPLLVQTENAPIIGVEAFLYFKDDEGLSLLWYTPLQEDSEDLDDLRRTPLSDLVTKVEYVYWDERFEKWESETEPKEGEGDDQFILPRLIKLTFEYEGVTKERTLTIPVTSRNALIF